MAKPDSPAEEAQETQKAQKEKPSSKVSSLTLSGQILARWAALDEVRAACTCSAARTSGAVRMQARHARAWR